MTPVSEHIPDDLAQRVIENGRVSFGDGWQPSTWTYAPGRLELLGNHVDYNGGPVLAGAIDRLLCTASANDEDEGRITCVAPDIERAAFTLDIQALRDWTENGHQTTASYAKGVIAALLGRELPLNGGISVSIAGAVPLGVGMSSSAALCVALVLACTDETLDPMDIVLIAQEAEHRAGSPVGAMDQAASVAGGVILFEGQGPSFSRIEPDLDNHVFAVADSGVSHQLGTSSYSKRVRESADALDWLKTHGCPDLGALGQLTPKDWSRVRSSGTPVPPAYLPRINHIVTEVDRVRRGEDAIRERNWSTFGRLMNESGASSAGDYAISHPLVEELVAEMRSIPGVLGARMMGGGEGGPALALMRADSTDAVRSHLQSGYFARHPDSPVDERFQVCVFGPGAGRV